MIDAHCHLDDPRLEAQVDEWLTAAAAVGVRHHVLAGVSPRQWPRAVALAARHPGLTVTHGLHPAWVAEGGDWQAGLEALAAARPRIVGECGLDARYPELPRQEEAFVAQLALARQLDAPVVLHVVRAHPQALDVIARDGLPRAGGLVHAFSGSAELAERYLRAGLSLSFSGGLLRGPVAARRLYRALLATPDERLLFETDAPDQAPEERARPGTWLPELIHAAAVHRGCSVAALADLSARNASALLSLDSA